MVAQGSLSQSEPLHPVSRMPQPQSVLSPRSQRSIEQIAAGLAKIAIESTIAGIYHEAVCLLSRLPAVATVAVLRPDDHGLLSVSYQSGDPIQDTLATACATALHQQWIASHARDGDVTGPAPEPAVAMARRGGALALFAGFFLLVAAVGTSIRFTWRQQETFERVRHTLTVESELGKGSTFRVVLPWMKADVAQSAARTAAKLDDMTRPRRVDLAPQI